MFLHLSVILSTNGGGGGCWLSSMHYRSHDQHQHQGGGEVLASRRAFPVDMTRESVSWGVGVSSRGRGCCIQGICIQGGLHPRGGGGLHLGGGVLHPGGRGLHPGGSASKREGVLHPGGLHPRRGRGLPKGGRGFGQTPAPMPEQGNRAVYILLECFLFGVNVVNC